MTIPKQPDQRFPRRERLTLDRQFEAVFRGRRSAAGERIVVYGLPNQLGYNRLGLVVGRRLGTAVVRNRFKRIVREAFRLSKPDQPAGWDWLVLPRLGKKKSQPSPWSLAAAAGRVDVTSELVTLMRKLAASSQTGRRKRGTTDRRTDS